MRQAFLEENEDASSDLTFGSDSTFCGNPVMALRRRRSQQQQLQQQQLQLEQDEQQKQQQQQQQEQRQLQQSQRQQKQQQERSQERPSAIAELPPRTPSNARSLKMDLPPKTPTQPLFTNETLSSMKPMPPRSPATGSRTPLRAFAFT
eukprot:TRINITY_DN3679_c0_g1_i1.p1 TRINITY_DN3679_c0_g1~~TRINITY_DN3679_c0_g1_i1.p1  ORF type:complete len:148 (+),score=56.66 TRINITY_DN3679_c0_g1_i1:107-550(+)